MRDDGAWNTVVVVEVECKGTGLTDLLGDKFCGFGDGLHILGEGEEVWSERCQRWLLSSGVVLCHSLE